MEVSVESVSGLKRRVSVSIPNNHVEQQVQQRLKNLASRVKMDGFRPGKAPIELVKKQYLPSVRLEVAQGILEETLPQALAQESLSPVSSPSIEKFDIEPDQNFNYIVSFEVLPEINVMEPNEKIQLELIRSKINAQDVDEMIEKLRKQNQTWSTVTRKAKTGDQVVFDFDGSVEGEPIEGGQANDFSLELGSGQMIPGFEDGLIGHQAGYSFELSVTFPEDYHEKKLAGKPAVFKIAIKEVKESVLAELNAEFVKQFGIDSGELADLKKDIEANMQRELDRRLREINHDSSFNALADANEFDLPEGLIEKEIEHLKHEMYHRIFGHEHHDNEKIPDFPRDLFLDRAQKRVKLGLLFAEYVKQHSIVADPSRVEDFIHQSSLAYSNPEEFKQKCHSDKQWLAEIEGAVIEQLIAERIQSKVTIKEKQLSYQETMNYSVNPKKDKDA